MGCWTHGGRPGALDSSQPGPIHFQSHGYLAKHSISMALAARLAGQTGLLAGLTSKGHPFQSPGCRLLRTARALSSISTPVPTVSERQRVSASIPDPAGTDNAAMPVWALMSCSALTPIPSHHYTALLGDGPECPGRPRALLNASSNYHAAITYQTVLCSRAEGCWPRAIVPGPGPACELRSHWAVLLPMPQSTTDSRLLVNAGR